MTDLTEGLGARLRRLLDLLDGDLEAIYADEAPGYRPRYTPIMKVLANGEPHTIKDLARRCGVSHSAASQTVSRMVAGGFAVQAAGADARERAISLGPCGAALLPRLQARWAMADEAAAGLEAEIGLPLAGAVTAAIAALEARPFRDRVLEARPPGEAGGRSAPV